MDRLGKVLDSTSISLTKVGKVTMDWEYVGDFRYRIKSLGASSIKFGPCEVCGKPATEVFLQIEQRKYQKPSGEISYTQHGCRDMFGHYECLLRMRRKEAV
ncbi:hypothetical protein SAMN02745885_01631 [Carboxydocella sporoproducens DSM 16521]|uniref:Uncharacterized protein n=2 Tax=Carboxydocella TaxID=178898 RepID=A0A1T4QEH2_9FIRM|nr:MULTISPECIES: hypothetical protein [Carboxydocella]AVX21620.1 hypothetical protein CFE_2477 [Carboxydocella thermautotrophica]SKA02036.1 hypothetical protein SAMN02745885_01631 [Carboxydocella sporoproducens DSM 16521]